MKDITKFYFGCLLFHCVSWSFHTASGMLKSWFSGGQSMTDSEWLCVFMVLLHWHYIWDHCCAEKWSTTIGNSFILANQTLSRWHFMVDQNLMNSTWINWRVDGSTASLMFWVRYLSLRTNSTPLQDMQNSAKSSLGITDEKYCFVPVKMCFICHFS